MESNTLKIKVKDHIRILGGFNMEKLIFKGTQEFMEKEIPVICGGFGDDQKCISDKTVAELHNMNTFDVRRRITDSIKRFKEDIDFIDLKQRMHQTHTLELLLNIGYAKQSITQAEHIYLLSKRGYAKLIKIFDTDLAWEVYENLLDRYFYLEENQKISLPTTYKDALKELLNKLEENENLQQQLEEQKPKVLFANAVSISDKCILVRELAKLLNQNGIDIGGTRLYEWLRTNNYLISSKCADYNTPTQKSIDMGLFKLKKTAINCSDGSSIIKNTVMVTPKGQIYFINKFLKSILIDNSKSLRIKL